MAVHYCYTIDPPASNHEHVEAGGMRPDGTLVRKLAIPESPDEELRGEKYSQEMIDWLHNSERAHIVRTLPTDSQLTKVWTEKVGTIAENGGHDYLTKAKQVSNIQLQPAND
jgi:hypothetical protein